MAWMPKTYAWMLAVLLPVGLPGLASTLRADGIDALHHLVADFDFEGYESAGEPLPKGWVKSALPDGKFPAYVVGRLADDHARGGRWSFRLALDAANVAYTYVDPLPVNPNNDYLLTGWVRTEKLQVSRVQVRLFMVDTTGTIVPGTMSISKPLGEPGGPSDGQWTQFSLRLQGEFPSAANLRITLALLQPRLWQGEECSDIYQQDIEAIAWFDDIRLYRLPRIALTADAPANVFDDQAEPQLTVLLQGMDQSDFGAVLTVFDAAGSVQIQRVIESEPNLARNEVHVSLPTLPPGLYQAELAISAGESVLVREYCTFARAATLPPSGRSRLGIDASTMPSHHWPQLLTLARLMRASELKLSAWASHQPSRNTNQVNHDQPSMQAMLDSMARSGMTPTVIFGSLPPPPRGSAGMVGNLIDALAANNVALRQAIELVLAQYGPQVAAWQVMRTGDEESLWNAQLSIAQQVANQWVGKLLPHQGLLYGWNALYDYDSPARGDLSLQLPSTTNPEYISGQIANFDGRIHDVHLQLLGSRYQRLQRLADFALRYAYTRASGIDLIFLDPLWTIDDQGRVAPDEALLIARTLAAYLGDARYMGTFRLDEASVALLFRKVGGEGVLMLYDQTIGTRTDDLLLALPPSAHAVDLWGRPTTLPRRDGLAVVKSSPLPILIAGCHAESLALRASLTVTPQAIPSTYEEHQATLSFTNPYDQGISGRIQIEPPEGWVVNPRMSRFTLNPGQSWSVPLTLRFPYNASTGLKQFDVSVHVDNRSAWSIQAPAYFYLDLEGVVFDVMQSVGADGTLEIQQIITNRTDKPISFQCFAQAPDRARQTRAVSNLSPGATAVKVFRFPNVSELRGRTVLNGLRQMSGSAILNRTITVR